MRLINKKPTKSLALASALALGTTLYGALLPLQADETCQSPYMAKIVGQEDFVYVWTLGIEGLGDGQDKLVTIDVNPKSSNYGKVVDSLSVGGRNEAHHSGFTDDRHYLWAGGLDTNKLFIFDVHSDPAKPKLHKVITDFVEKSGGVVGPHTTYALPGRIMITGLSNNKDHGGRTALVEYTNEGEYVATHWMPTDQNLRGAEKTGKYADGYNYDVRVLPRRNIMLTSSFTGWSNYMMDFGKMLQDKEAMKRFGNTVVLWDLHSKKPKKVFDVPGAPLEIRCAWQPNHNWCVTTTALTSKIWLIYEDKQGEWQAKAVADVGDPSKVPLPVDISISSDDSRLWVNTFMDGKTRLFDMRDPHAPKQVYEKVIGRQVNMASSSWDSTRIYYTSSLLANWDKKGEDNEQYFKSYVWDGGRLVEKFAIDFNKEKLGRAHQMRFGAYSLYGAVRPEDKDVSVASLPSISQ
ncbi:MAG: selenium-binding protein [gamma proteobacterium symbiont of Ctena orbiculata]|uniref:Methanethiol oxidase n=1 Tax=Candidatus Thiodiazotropha taylori TaxID=2792791 RepID=A0A944MCV5_9GAMM|nr:selenium-binding family protein [Candidatus Thiodiazotropha taylori]PUB89026.1 MAG: selenium-binding protein [gamma proteobacterium symbiont of Ctena orbiculata]MBT2991072.1 selenium-binding family protein [Candidatus Thiodiazotropha taylori]MBT2996590.1 selenium-binding family protein [Candidatus Thiodiazotropha taylori]MBT3000630.1 selenium-binding family protein [Candidatus Thiodiazotropha taylori]